MSEKKDIDLNVLEDADDDVLKNMSLKYFALDSGDVHRIFSKSIRKYKKRRKSRNFSEAYEVKGVDVYMRPK